MYACERRAYDLNSNVTERIDDAVEGQSGSGTKRTYTYDSADWLKTQLDFLAGGCRKIKNEFTTTGWEDTRVVRRSSLGCSDLNATFFAKQSTDWDYFANGKLKTLTTRNGSLTGDIIEQHDLDYVKDNVYLNGHRVSDRFFRSAPGDDQSPKCGSAAARCTATYGYDARDRLTSEFPGHGTEATTGITYKLDAAGNVTQKQVGGASPATYAYSGSRLDTITQGTTVRRYLYDGGNLECVVAATYSGQCEPARGTADLYEFYS